MLWKFRLLVCIAVLIAGCHSKERIEEIAEADVVIPEVYLDALDSAFEINKQGIALYEGARYSGFVHQKNDHLVPIKTTGFVDGLKEGEYVQWYPNGQIAVRRYYHLGEKQGEHRGWYPNGQLKFVYTFLNGKSVGEHRQWYDDGSPFELYHFVDGKHRGRQKVWRKDGKLRANYFVDEKGRTFGLQGLKRCKNVDTDSEKLKPLTPQS